MRLICLLFACAGLYAQSFPAAVFTPLVAKDNLTTKLMAAMTPTDSVAVVQSSAGWLPNMVASMCESASNGVCTGGFEMLLVTNVAGNVLTVTRGYSGSTAVPHANGRTFVNSINSAYNSSLTSEVHSLENWAYTQLGSNHPQVWIGPYGTPSNLEPTRLAVATNNTWYNNAFFTGGANSAVGVSVGDGTASADQLNGINVFLNAGSSFGSTGYIYRGGFFAEVIAQAGPNQWAPFGFFGETTIYSNNADGYGVFSIVQCGSTNGCADNVGHGVLANYFSAKDYVSTPHAANMVIAEFNMNNRAPYKPGHYLDGWTALNIVRAPGNGPGAIPGGTAVQAAANWYDDITGAPCVMPNCGDWARGFYYATGHNDGIAFEANYIPTPSSGLGDWRILSNPDFTLRTNTNSSRDWSTYVTPLRILPDGTVFLGGDSFNGGNPTIGVAPNGGGVVFYGMKAVTGKRTLCIDTTGLITSVAGPCPAGS